MMRPVHNGLASLDVSVLRVLGSLLRLPLASGPDPANEAQNARDTSDDGPDDVLEARLSLLSSARRVRCLVVFVV